MIKQSQHKINGKINEQFKHHLEQEGWTTTTYPDYNHLKEEHAKKREVLNKNVKTFGNSVTLAAPMVVQDGAVAIAYENVLKDYFNAKVKNFPLWSGLPDITVKPQPNLDMMISWHVNVPKHLVINPDDLLEEDLWNS